MQDRRGIFYLRGESAKVKGFPCLHPLSERAEAAAGNHDPLGFPGGWIHDRSRLEIRHLAALRLHVGVADVVTRQWPLARNSADFGHTKRNLRL
jgi:hypothetical protein